MNTIPRIVLFFLILSSSSVVAQDYKYSQFFASPMYLNPALTGAFDGKLRLSSIYRDQWNNQFDAPMTNFSASMDLRFELNQAKRKYRDAAAFGLLVASDKSGDIRLNSTNFALSGAFHKSLNSKNTQYLILGLQLGIIQRRVSYQDIRFSDQFDGLEDYNNLTAEDLPENNYTLGDFSLGLAYLYSTRNNFGIYSGLGIHHINQPNISFYNTEEFQNVSIPLAIKYSAFLTVQLPLTQGIQMLPRGSVQLQGDLLDANAGATFRFAIDKYKGTAFHIGAWGQMDMNPEGGLLFGSVVSMIGIEYKKVLFGFSYDIPTADLNMRRNVFEVSVGYQGSYDDDMVICPKF